MKYVVLLFFIPLSTSAQVLKIRSYPCHEPSRARTGSAALVDGTPIGVGILTSSHVIYHGSTEEKVCTEVMAENHPWIPAKLVHVNSAMGLALLEPSAELLTQASGHFSLEAIPSVEAGAKVALSGFPFASLSAVSEAGSVLIPRSQRVSLPLVSSAIEIQGAHNEYGMSGGALLETKSNGYLGLLSHQYLRIAEGKPAQVQAGETKDKPAELVALAIPSDQIVAWFRALREGKGELREDLSEQIQGNASLTFDNVRITASHCAGSGGVGGEGVAVGGIGGEGVGVGGGASVPHSSEACVVSLRVVEPGQANSQAWPFDPSSSWFTKTRERLVYGTPKWFTEVYRRKGHQRVRVHGLYHALTLMREGYLPLLRGNSAQDPALGAEYKLQLATFRSAIEGLRHALPEAQEGTDMRQLLDHFEVLQLSFESTDFELIDTQFYRRVARVGSGGMYVDAWTDLFNADFDHAVQVIKTVTWMCDYIDGRQH